jgi:nickel/cobalt exporter
MALKRGLGLVAIFVALLGGVLPQVVDAHPLGNFTINHYSRIEPAGNAIQLHYVLDMAEIPTFQDKSKIDPNPDAYGDAKANELSRNLHLTLDGKPTALQVLTRALSFPEGQGGLPTLRLEVIYTAELPGNTGSPVELSYRDDNDVDRIGWREIVVRPGTAETQIQQSSVSQQDQSDELRNYPADLLSSPLAVRDARITFVRGGVAAVPTLANPALVAISHTQTAFAELAMTDLSLQTVLIALVIAMFFGAQHALQPGHGKTIVAAYLVGSRGTPKHALFLGGTVTATHTAGVYLLGFVTLFLSTYVVPEKLYPIIGVGSGLVVVGMGGWLLFSRVRGILRYRRGVASAPTGHDHGDDAGHTHTHGLDANHVHTHPAEHAHHTAHSNEPDHSGLAHSHGGRAHSHLPPGANGDPITWRSLLALGVTGGALPCPEALVVLLATMALGRVAFGLLLILAFSIGLAGVLVGFGLLLVYARSWFSRVNFGSGLVPRLLSVASALVIVGAGSFITLQAGAQGF